MLEFTFRFTLADETSTDEALIAGLPQDLRAIADQVAQAWPGGALDASLGAQGVLARPARLDVDLAHGGHARIEVHQFLTEERKGNARNADDSARRHQGPEADLETQLAMLTTERHWQALQESRRFREMLDLAETALAAARPVAATQARRLLAAFSAPFRDLQARNRSGDWASLATTPSADPYYVCAVFGVGDAVQRVPLPQILPEAAASRRSFSLPPETVRLVTLLEQVVPEQLDAVREAGRAYLVRRRDWLSQGRIGK